MTGVPLTVRPLDTGRYEVVSGDHSYTVDASAEPPACTCEAYHYRPKSRPCKHGWAVLRWKADPLGPRIDAMSEKQVLDLIDPSNGSVAPPRLINPDERAIALATLRQWEELDRAKRPIPLWLFRAACEVRRGLEHEQIAPSIAASCFHAVCQTLERKAEQEVARAS